MKNKNIEIIYQQTMSENGFLTKLRENVVDKNGYLALIQSIRQLTHEYKEKKTIDKRLVAYLFELPWEIENCVEHYASVNPELGSQVSLMSERLRNAIYDLFWTGL